MNRLFILVASLTLAIVTISSTCLAEPADLAGMTPRSTAAAGDHDGAAFSFSATIRPSLMAGEGQLSL